MSRFCPYMKFWDEDAIKCTHPKKRLTWCIGAACPEYCPDQEKEEKKMKLRFHAQFGVAKEVPIGSDLKHGLTTIAVGIAERITEYRKQNPGKDMKFIITVEEVGGFEE
jgi:hypothetical protein